MSNNKSNHPDAHCSREDQSRLPESFSLGELGDWIPAIYGLEDGEPIPSLVMAMDTATRDLAYTLGRRVQGDTRAIAWSQVNQPPTPVLRDVPLMPGMTQDWLPNGGRVVAPWQSIDPRPYHAPPSVTFRFTAPAQPPPGMNVRQYFGEHYHPRFPRQAVYWPSAPWRALTYEAVGDLARTIVFDFDGDRHRIVGTTDRAVLLPGALAAIFVSAREILALVTGAEMLLQPFGLRAPAPLPVTRGEDLLHERGAVQLLNDIDDWRTEMVSMLSFVRMAAEFLPGQAHRLAPMGWMNPVRPEASFASTLAYWGASEMPFVGFSFDASVPEHALPPLRWLASRGVDYRWFWPYDVGLHAHIIPRHVWAFNPDTSPHHNRSPAPFYLDVLRQRHCAADNDRRAAIQARRRAAEHEKQRARERAPYAELGQLILLRPQTRNEFDAVFREGALPGRWILEGWERVDGPPAIVQAIEDDWITRFRHITDWPERGNTTFLGWLHPDGTTVSRQEVADYVRKRSKAKKRRADEAFEADEDELGELGLDMGGGPAAILFEPPQEAEPPAWDHLQGSSNFAGPRYNFEADLQPLTGDFPSRFSGWRKRPSTIIRIPPPATSAHPGPRSEDRESVATSGKGKARERDPSPVAPAAVSSLLRAAFPMGAQDTLNDEEARLRQEEDVHRRELQENARIAELSLQTAREDVRRWEARKGKARANGSSPAPPASAPPSIRAISPLGSQDVMNIEENGLHQGEDVHMRELQENERIADLSLQTAREEQRSRWEESVRTDASVAGPSRLAQSTSGPLSVEQDIEMGAPPREPQLSASRATVALAPWSPPREPRSMRTAPRAMNPHHNRHSGVSGTGTADNAGSIPGHPQSLQRGQAGLSPERRILSTWRSFPTDLRSPHLPAPPQSSSTWGVRTGPSTRGSQGQRSSTSSVQRYDPLRAQVNRISHAEIVTTTATPHSRWAGGPAAINVEPMGPRRVHTTLLPYVPESPVRRALSHSSVQAVPRLYWQPRQPGVDDLPDISFVEGIRALIGGGTAGEDLPVDIVRPNEVAGNNAYIRLGVPALLMRRYVQVTIPGTTVRQFVVWMLRHGTPFGWAHVATPASLHLELPMQFQSMVPTFEEWHGRVAAMLQEKPWARAFVLGGGIGWRLALWVGGQVYADQVALGPSVRARRYGEELDWPQHYVWDEAPGEAYDVLSGRSGTFSLWPHQDVWDSLFGNAIWSPAHENWFQTRLTALQGETGGMRDRAIGDGQWWHELHRGRRPRERRSIREHTPTTWTEWAARGGVHLTGDPVILPIVDLPL
ncbi:unnamed protein product [Peniophora sp. CBMAI 1063]|nr:unnamed protein product [Peniophora sp. CBMAI 1063]